MVRLLITLGLAAGLAGCGLIDESVDDFSLQLPEKEFSVDSEMWGLQGTGTFPSVECPAFDCAAMSSSFCESTACMVSCGTGGTCQASTTITLRQMVHMAADSPELAQIDAQSGVDITIEEISFVIEQNTFPASYTLPMLNVYVGPLTAVGPMDEGAEQIGTIAPVMGGFVGNGQLDFLPGGKDALERYMSEHTVPFNLLVGGEVTVGANQEIPQGVMVGKVTGRASADVI